MNETDNMTEEKRQKCLNEIDERRAMPVVVLRVPRSTAEHIAAIIDDVEWLRREVDRLQALVDRSEMLCQELDKELVYYEFHNDIPRHRIVEHLRRYRSGEDLTQPHAIVWTRQ